MDGVTSGLTLVAAGVAISKTAKRYCHNYRDAPGEIHRAQQQGQQFCLNKELLDKLPSSYNTCIGELLKDAQKSLSEDLQMLGKTSRRRWVMGRKSEVEDKIRIYNQIESSISYNVLMSLCRDFEKLRFDTVEQHENLTNKLKLYQNAISRQGFASSHYVRERIAAEVRSWDWLSNTLGLKSTLITSIGNSSTTQAFAQWSLRLSFGYRQIIIGCLIIKNSFPTILRMRLCPQNLISAESQIIKASQNCDVEQIWKLLERRQAHPNDRTPDNLTVLRFGIRTGDPEVVRILLEHGADPNLPFGELGTSPLNNAFLIGNVTIIRMLLNAGALLDYKNSRTWTSLSFLWDPHRPRLASTTEIIDICMSQGFSAWNDTDIRGWSAVHRAAAYGIGEDMLNLEYKGANLHSYTTDHLWGPITCAVWNKNISTFDALMMILPTEEIVEYRDSRGWSLLHFAAQNGCEHILRRVLEVGVDRQALTIGSKDWVTEGLEWKSLTASELAHEYGYGDLWATVTKNSD